ncbi:MAG: ABC transporter permease, partial [Arenimonas sp.]
MEIRPILSSLLRNKTGALLIAMQVALTLAIVANALYIVKDRLSLSTRPTGIADEANYFRIITSRLDHGGDHFADQQRDEAVLRAVPGVVAATWSNQSPLARSGWNMSVQTAPDQTNSDVNAAFYMMPNPVAGAMGLKLVEGRDFTADDIVNWDPEKDNNSGRIAIVTKFLAKKLYPDGSAIGKSIYFGGSPDDPRPMTIVGVVERLQTPWAQTSENADGSVVVATRYGDYSGNYLVRVEPGQLDRVMRDAEAALLKAEPRRLVHGKRSLVEDRALRYRDDRAIAWMLATVTALLL